jgi:hypothetical protein
VARLIIALKGLALQGCTTDRHNDKWSLLLILHHSYLIPRLKSRATVNDPFVFETRVNSIVIFPPLRVHLQLVQPTSRRPSSRPGRGEIQRLADRSGTIRLCTRTWILRIHDTESNFKTVTIRNKGIYVNKTFCWGN